MSYGRELLKAFEPYVPGEQPAGQSRVVKLNTNENPYPPSPRVREAVQALDTDAFRKYPDPVSLELRSAFARRFDFDGPEWVISGNGMDELLAMALRAFVDPGDTVVSVHPTYVLYKTLSELHGARVESVELDAEFQVTDAMMNAQGRLCFFPRPNAPSGVCVPRDRVEAFCSAFDGIVVIDEAYADFAADTCIDFPMRHDNVLVMRTFSKSFSLAGLRIGLAAGRPELIAELFKTKDSYNLNAVSQAAALAALEDYDYMLGNATNICATRQRLTEALRESGFTVPDSQSNFVLARWDGTPSARDIFIDLRDRGILVRYFDEPRLDACLRISVGTDDEIDMLLQALRDVLAT